MKMCQKHWDKLREAVKDAGMAHLIAPDGEEAASRQALEIEKGEVTQESFDPLMAAHNAIASRAIEAGGLYLLGGDYCPVCEAIANRPAELTEEGAEKFWTEGPVEAVRKFAQEKKFIPGAQ